MTQAQTCHGCCVKEQVLTVPTGTRNSTTGYRFVFKIHGMDCAEEVAILKREVGPVVGGADKLDFDLLNAKMMVAADAGLCSAETVRAAVARTGMRAEAWKANEGTREPDPEGRSMQAALAAVSGFFVLAGLALHALIAGRVATVFGGIEIPLTAKAAYGLAIAFGGRYVIVKAWYAARRFRPDMNLLMTVAVAGAILLGDWLEAATVAFLFALSLALESWSVGRARNAIAALLELAPPMARLLEASVEREVPAGEVPIGARFIVKPGERIPLDGLVASGTSAVNQAPITGESIPVSKQPDSEVFAGTINGEGVLEIVSTKRASGTMLAHIIKLVEAAQGRRSRSEQWVEEFARVYACRDGSCHCRGSAAAFDSGRGMGCLVLQSFGAARDCLSLRSRHLDSRERRGGLGSRGPQRHPRQRRRVSRIARTVKGHCV